MTQDTEILRIIRELGEMRGQLNEVVRSVNLMASKIDDLTRQVSASSGIPEDVKDLQRRVRVLEDKESERNGAIGIAAWLAKSPLLAWLMALGAAAWLAFKGKILL